MEASKQTILCIEDDKDTCDLIEFMFRQAGYQVSSCSTAEDGLRQVRQGNFEAVILDNHLRGISGYEVCREIRTFDQNIPVIFFSGEARAQEKEKALAAGASAYLIKPNDFEKLTETVIGLIKANK
jgi:two-component system OmpR family response regulator